LLKVYYNLKMADKPELSEDHLEAEGCMDWKGYTVIAPNFDEKLSDVPSCDHGPALLFERVKKNGIKCKFYACSTCRERKDCKFFQWVEKDDIKIPIKKKELNTVVPKTIVDQKTIFSHIDHVERLQKFCQLPESERHICRSCSRIVLPNEKESHKSHGFLKIRITKDRLREPTKLLMPLKKAKKEAQFFFDLKTTDFIVSTLKKLGFQSVLCIGCPRIHERILMDNTMNSFLLDIDQRFYQFYSPSQFCEYNMFNHHFFHGDEAKVNLMTFMRSVQSDKLTMILDPPFGGLVKVLAQSLRCIEAEAMQTKLSVENTKSDLKLSVFLVFPYYFEKKIMEHLPNFVMLDYQVNYETGLHPYHKKNNRGSPIRIFTNFVPVRKIVMPGNDYRYCDLCEKYVSMHNVHCNICGVCPSKNGRPYVHCEPCQRCVKASFTHCDRCGYCLLKLHDCDLKIANEANLPDQNKASKRHRSEIRRRKAIKRQKKDAKVVDEHGEQVVEKHAE